MTQIPENKNNTPASSEKAKKPYSSPRLLEYGAVAKLTQSSNSFSTDGNNTAMACL